jgi:hypothetical protein
VSAGLGLLSFSLPAILAVYAHTLATVPDWMNQIIEVAGG